MKHVAIFASGTGTNAAAIIEFFKGSEKVKVGLILTNNPKAGVINVAIEHAIPVLVFNRKEFNDPKLLDVLATYKIDLIVLAGFLWLIPMYLVKAYQKRLINIHPALLPRYGGKGMYGKFVHEAVKRSGDKETGITIHYVDEHYDKGTIILQKTCTVTPEDTPDTISKKVQELEHHWLPRVVEECLG